MCAEQGSLSLYFLVRRIHLLAVLKSKRNPHYTLHFHRMPRRCSAFSLMRQISCGAKFLPAARRTHIMRNRRAVMPKEKKVIFGRTEIQRLHGDYQAIRGFTIESQIIDRPCSPRQKKHISRHPFPGTKHCLRDTVSENTAPWRRVNPCCNRSWHNRKRPWQWGTGNCFCV